MLKRWSCDTAALCQGALLTVILGAVLVPAGGILNALVVAPAGAWLLAIPFGALADQLSQFQRDMNAELGYAD